MFRIANIEEVNKISRELGNKLITETSKYIQNNISDTYIFVRYMGPKFVIVFCGVDSEAVLEFINEIKDSVENLEVKLENNFEIKELDELKEENSKLETKSNKKGRRKKKREIKTATPQLNFVISTYYKGTGLEEVLRKMENCIDEESKEDAQITSI